MAVLTVASLALAVLRTVITKPSRWFSPSTPVGRPTDLPLITVPADTLVVRRTRITIGDLATAGAVARRITNAAITVLTLTLFVRRTPVAIHATNRDVFGLVRTSHPHSKHCTQHD